MKRHNRAKGPNKCDSNKDKSLKKPRKTRITRISNLGNGLPTKSKCPYCEKYFYEERNLLDHIYKYHKTKDGHIKTIHSANLTRFYIKSKTMMIYRITCRIMFIFSRFCAKLVFHPFSANLYTTHKGLGEICCSIF